MAMDGVRVDGQTVFATVGGGDFTVTCWNMVDDDPSSTTATSPVRTKRLAAPATVITLRSDARLIACGGQDGRVRLLRAKDLCYLGAINVRHAVQAMLIVPRRIADGVLIKGDNDDDDELLAIATKQGAISVYRISS